MTVTAAGVEIGSDVTEHAAWVDGARLSGAGLDAFPVSDPSTGQHLVTMRAADAETVGLAVDSASAALAGWRASPPVERSRTLMRIAEALRAATSSLALLEAMDAGVPLGLAQADVQVAARYFEFYAGVADKHAGETIPLGEAFLDYTVREPWGVCGIIVPFNFPLQQVTRSVSAALATGNTVVVKASERSPLVATALARVCREAGLPDGVFNVVHGLAETGDVLIGHPGVAHLTFTGSRPVGEAIMRACASRVLPLTLELGGKSAHLVLDRSRLADAASAIVGAMFRTAGQACSAGSRILVRGELHDELLELVAGQGRALRVGAATEPGVEVGPLISAEQRDRVLAMIDGAVATGARLVTGGRPAPGTVPDEGNFVLPTVFDDVDPHTSLSRQEVFGPVLGITPVRDAEEALAMANDSEFGLVAGVWTDDLNLAHDLAGRLEVGQVFVNNYGAGGGVELPFGGRRGSGFGREKGLAALDGYTQLKNVCIRFR